MGGLEREAREGVEKEKGGDREMERRRKRGK